MQPSNLHEVNALISFVVPAHNEEACLPRTLRAIDESARVAGQPYEIIVVDDASTDRTAILASELGARVVSVQHRQIAATRNSGARAAHGERIFFVDADTTINARAVLSALRCMNRGAVGGGALVRVEGKTPLYVTLIAVAGMLPAKMAGFCGGSFMFCTREAFAKSGGFNERLYWAEEGSLTLALKRQGPFVVLWNRIQTSGRRFNTTSGVDLLAMLARMIVRPKKTFTERKSVEKIWYNSNRARDNDTKRNFSVRFLNGVILVFFSLLFTGPVWNFIPWSQTPLGTAFGKFRFLDAILLCHAGLCFWPIAVVLFLNLLRQKWSREWLRSAAVIAFCAWQAWASSIGVITIWMIILDVARN